MSRKERYPRDTNSKKPTQTAYKPQCSNGWHCKDLLDNRCQLSHDKDDFKYAKKIKATFNHSQTVVILDTYDPKLRPVCLLDPFLVPNITNLNDFKMDVGRYYLAQLLDNTRPRSIDLTVQKELGLFGRWQVQQRILHDYFPKEYELPPTDKQTKKGEVKINGQYQKVITGSQGKKYYFPIVNKIGPYPILGGCKVIYFQRGNTIELTKIIYPHQIRLCGIVQIDKNSQFYLVSRNEEYDDMNPYHVPTEIVEKLTELKGLFPYSFLRSEPIAEKDQQKVNEILKEYLVKGRFKAWPHQSLYPVVELLDEVSFKNFKSLKDGIIYEAGISMTPFDKKQKQQSQKMTKNFKIEEYAKNRGRLSKSIFTVDSKSTKCHDDALFIQPTSQDQFYVQIHIADVPALIKQADNIDKKIKKRDETIYIKNYHQPMLYDSLKNLFSLFEEEDRLAFTLAFKVNAKGFIDYKTVQFHRNIINVQKNLCHERIQSGSESYPELRQLNQLFQHSKLIDNNYILQSQTKSQIAINKLIFLSSIIPTFLLDANIKRAKEFKEKFEHYLKAMIDKRKKDMQKWEDILDRIDKEKDNERNCKKKIGAIKKKMDNEVIKQRAAVMKRLKQQNKDSVKKEKKEKIVGSHSSKNIQSEDQEDDLLALEQDYEKADEKRQEQQAQQEINEQVKQQEEKAKKEKRAKALKEVHASDFQSSSEQSFQEAKSESDSELLDEQYRFNAAVGGKRFLEKIFRHPLFNIDMKWSSLQEINNAFKTILSKDKGKLYQEYFKRLQIMNRQHFRYIVKMEKDSQRQKEEHKPVRREERIDVPDEPRSNKRKYIIKEQEMEEKQEKIQHKTEKETEYIVQPISKKQQSIVPKLKAKKQRKTEEQINQQQLVRNKLIDHYIAQKRRNQTILKDIKSYMKKQRQRFIEKYMKQYQKDKELKNIDLSFNYNDQYCLKDNDKKDYMNEKMKVLLNILRSQGQNIQRKAKRDEKKMLKKQSQNKDNNEKKDMKKQEKTVKEEALFMKGDDIETKAKQIIQQNKEAKKVELRNNELSLTHRLMSYMEAENDRLIQKYANNFQENPKLTDVDISFTERDQQIIENDSLQAYKKEKKLRLKVILRRHAKANKNKMKQQAKKDKVKPIRQKFDKKDEKILKQLQEEENNNMLLKKQEEFKQQKGQLQQQKSGKLEKILNQQRKTEEETQQEPSLKTNESKQQMPEKLTKKAMKKKIDDLMRTFIQQLNQKYKTEIQNLASKLQQINQNIKRQEKSLEEELSSANQEYNLLKLLAGQQRSQKKQGKKSKKDKKKDNEKTKTEKSSVLGKFLDNFQLYADKANYKFQKMSIAQLDEYLNKILTIHQLCQDSLEAVQKLNRQASKKGQAQQSLLKWNNPIRSYESLTVMRLIQSYKWLFEGQLFPSDIIRYYSDIKHIEKQLKELQEYRGKKIEKGELNKKVKEANRQISKLEFYNLLKRDENAVFAFLNIGSPNMEKVKFVFHPILEEVEVDNLEFRQDAYKEVKGRVRIVRQFPLKMKIILEK